MSFSKRQILVLIAGVLASPMFAQSFLEWKGLTPGQYAVGFRTVETVDPTRTIQSPTDYFGRPRANYGERPLHIAIWYPAQATASGKAMTYSDYVSLFGSSPGQSKELAEKRRDEELRYIQNVTPLAAPPNQTLMQRLLGERVMAKKNVTVLPGRFPVLIYAPGFGYPAFENSVMFEFLASHGYIVVAVPSLGADGKSMTGDASGLDAQVRDLEFLAGFVAALPEADLERIATAGFSWGGLSSVRFAIKNTRVKALICVDGTVRDGESLAIARSFHDFKPEQLRIPTLLVICSRKNSFPEFKDSSFIEQARYTETRTLELAELYHHDLASMSNLLRRYSEPGSTKDWTAVTRGFEALCQYVLNFLDTHLQESASAGQFLNQPGGDVYTVLVRKGQKAPPTSSDIVEILKVDGLARVTELIRQAKKAQTPSFSTFEPVINRSGYELLASGRGNDAVAILELNVECFPDSINAADSLGEAYLAVGDLARAEKCVLDVQTKLEKDQKLSPATKTQFAANAKRALEEIKKRREK